MCKKTEVIETLKMSVRIANSAVEALKQISAIKASDNTRLRVENINLSSLIDQQTELYDNAKIEIGQLNDQIAKNQNPYGLAGQAKEKRNESVGETILKEVNKPRTYFEIASSEPDYAFNTSEVAHLLDTYDGLRFNIILSDSSDRIYPVKSSDSSFTRSGKYNTNDKLRSLFTTAEMIEMGYTIPDLE